MVKICYSNLTLLNQTGHAVTDSQLKSSYYIYSVCVSALPAATVQIPSSSQVIILEYQLNKEKLACILHALLFILYTPYV